ncbi:MAG: ankyrin repeat domain-containing protein [Planctomycetota bacterium]
MSNTQSNETEASSPISRRAIAMAGLGLALSPIVLLGQNATSPQEDDKSQDGKSDQERGPKEKSFKRDYPAPDFQPSWKNDQINREMVADFVIYAHSDLKMVEKLFEREPGLLNSTMDWGNGDWEDALGGASHMGRRDIVEFLLSKGARPNLFCTAMLGLLESVKAMLNLQPELINAKGPHGFTLHFHAQVGQDEAKPVLDYLQSIKEVELKPLPMFMRRKK